jgi:hypothetical protein
VQTYARVGFPLRRILTRWRFGSKRRFVATIECGVTEAGLLPTLRKPRHRRRGSESSSPRNGLGRLRAAGVGARAPWRVKGPADTVASRETFSER